MTKKAALLYLSISAFSLLAADAHGNPCVGLLRQVHLIQDKIASIPLSLYATYVGEILALEEKVNFLERAQELLGRTDQGVEGRLSRTMAISSSNGGRSGQSRAE